MLDGVLVCDKSIKDEICGRGVADLAGPKFFVSSGRNPKQVRGEKRKGTHTRSKGQDFKKQKVGDNSQKMGDNSRTGTIQVQGGENARGGRGVGWVAWTRTAKLLAALHKGCEGKEAHGTRKRVTNRNGARAGIGRRQAGRRRSCNESRRRREQSQSGIEGPRSKLGGLLRFYKQGGHTLSGRPCALSPSRQSRKFPVRCRCPVISAKRSAGRPWSAARGCRPQNIASDEKDDG